MALVQILEKLGPIRPRLAWTVLSSASAAAGGRVERRQPEIHRSRATTGPCTPSPAKHDSRPGSRR